VHLSYLFIIFGALCILCANPIPTLMVAIFLDLLGLGLGLCIHHILFMYIVHFVYFFMHNFSLFSFLSLFLSFFCAFSFFFTLFFTYLSFFISSHTMLSRLSLIKSLFYFFKCIKLFSCGFLIELIMPRFHLNSTNFVILRFSTSLVRLRFSTS
jgi:hypothetical protein